MVILFQDGQIIKKWKGSLRNILDIGPEEIKDEGKLEQAQRPRAHRDHPLGVGHLIINAANDRRHLECNRTCNDH